MLERLRCRLGHRWLCACLGVSALTVNAWRDGSRLPSGGARRAIWFLWCLVFHPERLSSLEDLATWGRLHGRGVVGVEPIPEDWSI